MNTTSLNQKFPDYEQYIKKTKFLFIQLNSVAYCKLLGFLNLVEFEIVNQFCSFYTNIKMDVFQTHPNCEKKLVILNLNEDINSFFTCIKISYNNRYKQIKHSDVLGYLLNNDFKNNDFSDIYVDDDMINLAFLNDSAERLLNSNIFIANVPVKIIKIEELKTFLPQYKEISFVSTSLRIDNILSRLCNISRDKSKKIIDKKLVTINLQVSRSSSVQISIGDVIRVQRKGKFTIKAINITSKNKFRVVVDSV